MLPTRTSSATPAGPPPQSSEPTSPGRSCSAASTLGANLLACAEDPAQCSDELNLATRPSFPNSFCSTPYRHTMDKHTPPPDSDTVRLASQIIVFDTAAAVRRRNLQTARHQRRRPPAPPLPPLAAPPRRRRVSQALLFTMRFNHRRLHVTLGPEPQRRAGPAAPRRLRSPAISVALPRRRRGAAAFNNALRQ